MASAAVAQRRGRPRAGPAGARQRGKLVLLAVLAAVLVALLAFEVPHLLRRSRAVSSTAASPLAALSSNGPALRNGAKALHGGSVGADPFAGSALPNHDARAVTAGGGDPFTGQGPAAPASAALPVPRQIVIGQRSGDEVAKHGWIVILASIPSEDGRASAARFAQGARAKVGPLSILNSSLRLPLRGGYWVVYSGPYESLAAVSRSAASIHAAGYGEAYIRELVTYR